MHWSPHHQYILVLGESEVTVQPRKITWEKKTSLREDGIDEAIGEVIAELITLGPYKNVTESTSFAKQQIEVTKRPNIKLLKHRSKCGNRQLKVVDNYSLKAKNTFGFFKRFVCFDPCIRVYNTIMWKLHFKWYSRVFKIIIAVNPERLCPRRKNNLE